MRKTKKQLLGLAGLLAVGVMTAVAYSMPAPDAAAASEDGVYTCDNNDPDNPCPSKSEGVNLQVLVTSPNTSMKIIKPQDKTITVGSSVPMEVIFSESNSLEFYLTRQSDGQRIDLPGYTTTQPSGTYSSSIDTTGLAFGEYLFHAVAHGNNAATADDTSSFEYRAITAAFEGNKENGDPILGINLNEKVNKVSVQIYNKKGEPLFVDANGNETPLLMDRNDIDPTTGKITATMPFKHYDADTGDYTATVTAYNNNDEVISMVTAATYYTNPERPVDPTKPVDPSTPDVPNTGILRIGNLNITRLDYLLTGLIAFGVAACFALYLVFRKKHRR